MRAIVPALILLGACATSPDAPDEPRATQAQIADGQFMAKTMCGACHATGRYDRSAHRDAPPFRTLSQRYPIDSLEEALAEGMMTGHPDMPEVKLEPDQITSLLGYINQIQDYGCISYSGEDY